VIGGTDQKMANAYLTARLLFYRAMNLDEAVDEALAAYGMSPSEEAEETGRMVATLQD
jgi:UDP-galactopyranose mutase